VHLCIAIVSRLWTFTYSFISYVCIGVLNEEEQNRIYLNINFSNYEILFFVLFNRSYIKTYVRQYLFIFHRFFRFLSVSYRRPAAKFTIIVNKIFFSFFFVFQFLFNHILHSRLGVRLIILCVIISLFRMIATSISLVNLSSCLFRVNLLIKINVMLVLKQMIL
jgi:hypothetical protein